MVGLPLEAAARLLTDAGFTVAERAEFSVRLPPGYVVRQSPQPGANRRIGPGGVTVNVSSADRRPVDVPDVGGLELAAARDTLEAAGFVVEAAAACPDDPPGCAGAGDGAARVWRQSPAAATSAPAHSVVTLAVYPPR